MSQFLFFVRISCIDSPDIPINNKIHPMIVPVFMVSSSIIIPKSTPDIGSNKLKIAVFEEPISFTAKLNKTLATYEVPTDEIRIKQ